jgi:hypothetical protein
MAKFLVVLSILILPFLGRAQVLEENLVSTIGFEPFSFSNLVNQKEKTLHSRFVSSDPNLSKPKKEKVKSSQDQAMDLITDKGVNLDIDNNGKDDFWRVYDKGRLAGIKIDANEDGFIDTYTKYSREGWVELEKLNRNFDKAYDVLKKCKAASDCVTLIDGDYDGFYEKKQVTKPIHGARIKKSTYYRSKTTKKWKKIKVNTYNSFQASEASVIHDCDGNCLGDITTKFGSVTEIESALRRTSSRTTTVRFTSTLSSGEQAVNTYDHIDDIGILVNHNCYDIIDKDKLIDQIKSALGSFLGCIGKAKGEFLSLKGSAKLSAEKDRFQNLANALQSNVAGGLLALLSENEIGKKVKLSCSGMRKGSVYSEYSSSTSKNEPIVKLSGAGMFAVPSGLIEVSKGDKELLSQNTIAVAKPRYLFDKKDASREDTAVNRFTKTFVHEIMHLIAGDVHGEHEAAIACSTMCELTTAPGGASESSKYICALSNEEAVGAELIGGEHNYLSYLHDVLRVNGGDAIDSPLTGIAHDDVTLRYIHNYLNRHSPELFEKITKDEDDQWRLYKLPFFLFFQEDPNLENIELAAPIQYYGYDINKSSDVHKYIISRVFSGDNIGDIMKEVKRKGWHKVKAPDKAGMPKSKTDSFLQFLLD